MKSPPFLGAILLTTIVSQAPAQSGRVFDNLAMQSTILGGERKYAVYLPPEYQTSSRSYPVLYLLHGRTDDQTGWVQFGEVQRIADEAIREGKATPMIIVMPDADTGRQGYVNTFSGDWRYEDFFFDEFIPYVESTYRARSARQYRAVAGLSMGGGGTFIYALHRPDMFFSAAPLSASLRTDIEDFKKYHKVDESVGGSEFETYYRRYSVLEMLANLPVDGLRSVRWYIDCGDEDRFSTVNSMAHIAMRMREIPHEFRIRDGGHTWMYWRSALPDVLAFVSEAFHR